MPGLAVSSPRDLEPAPDADRARREPAPAVQSSAARFAPLTFAPAAAGVVLLAEVAAVIRLVLGLPLLVAARPAGRWSMAFEPDDARRAAAEGREQRAHAEHPGGKMEETPDGVAPPDGSECTATLSGEPEADR
jgi:hypothetical protein